MDKRTCRKIIIDRNMIGEYTGDLKELKPITVTTYQCLHIALRLRIEEIRKDKIITAILHDTDT